MAEEDAEVATLRQMAAEQETGENDAAVAGAESRTSEEHSADEEEEKEEAENEDIDIAVAQTPRAASPSVPVIAVPENSDPLLARNPVMASLVTESPIVSAPSPRASIARPKTIAGFVADDSDSDDASVDISTITIPAHLKADGTSSTSTPRSPAHILENDGQHAEVAANASQRAPDAASTFSYDSNGAVNFVNSTITHPAGAAIAVQPKARLPHDTIGILEDRIKDDPRGDLEAWLALIAEHRKRNKLDDARAAYERCLKVFPAAAEIWVAYAEMEMENNNFLAVEQIFGKSLLNVPNVQLWSVYLDYIRRRNDLTNDVSGAARATITQSYDFVLQNVGIDRESGRIWQDYIQFIRGGPGQVTGNTWQDQQKMDQLRKVYQKAVCMPIANVTDIWKEYDKFEIGLNKMTGRKFLQERSPAYMTARSAATALENTNRGLIRTTLPRLPPALGFEGDQDYLTQVDLWRRWISFEVSDPLVLRDEDLAAYKQRVLFTYKQSLMSLRFWPEMWVNAAEWCFDNALEKEGNEFLLQGIAANPESCLLVFKQADRLEHVLPIEEGDEGLASRGSAIREPYNKLLDTLYDLLKQLKTRESAALTKIEEDAALDAKITGVLQTIEEDDEEVDPTVDVTKEAAKQQQINATKLGFAMQTQLLSRTVSYVWIALTRAMRRVQGKGKVGAVVGGSRQILSDARVRGKLTSEVYIANALIEHYVYKDPAGTRIFERGAKLFPEDEVFILEYMKHLFAIGDTINARALFETTVTRMAAKAELLPKTKVLYTYLHKYESEYGELSQISSLEKRMAILFPEDPKLARFASRYAATAFDPTAVRPIISPRTQMRPKALLNAHASGGVLGNNNGQMLHSPKPAYENSPRPIGRGGIDEPSPRPSYAQLNSPKRGFEDSDTESVRPNKRLARGESPSHLVLKGAAGRRLDQSRRGQAQAMGHNQGQTHLPQLQQHTYSTSAYSAAPHPLPRDITFLLSIIPGADKYDSSRFRPESMVRLLGQTYVPEYGVWKAQRDQEESMRGVGAANAGGNGSGGGAGYDGYY